MSENTQGSSELLWDASECILQLGCEEDPEMLHDVIATFLEDSRRRIAELHDAIGMGLSTELRKQAHSLKGSANQVGAKRMASLCKQLERRASEPTSAEWLALTDQLDAIFVATSKAMLAHVNGQV